MHSQHTAVDAEDAATESGGGGSLSSGYSESPDELILQHLTAPAHLKLYLDNRRKGGADNRDYALTVGGERKGGKGTRGGAYTPAPGQLCTDVHSCAVCFDAMQWCTRAHRLQKYTAIGCNP